MKENNIKRNNREVPEFAATQFKSKSTKYCLIIPVINEGKNIKSVLLGLKKYNKTIDIIIADGGSTDGSLKNNFLRSCGVNTLLVKKDKGKIGAQYRMGYAFAIKKGYKGVVHIDGNNKDDLKSIPQFIKELDAGVDYVQGSRFIKNGKAINTPKLRYFGIRFILSPILSLGAGRWFTDTSNGHRAYSKKLILDQRLSLFRNIFSSYEILFYVTARAPRLNLRVKEIPVVRKYPKGKVPTKIIGFNKNLKIIYEAIRTTLGYYNP